MRKKSKSKKVVLVSRIIYILHVIVSILFLYMITKLNVLPSNYLVIVYGIFAVFLVIFGLLLMRPKVKTKFKIILDVLCMILTLGYGFGTYYINQANNFLGNIQANDYQTETYYVLVRKDSLYDKLSDIKGKSMGYFYNTDSGEEALDKTLNKVNVITKEYKDYKTLTDDLLNKKIESIFISEAYKNMLSEDIGDIDSKVKSLFSIKIKIKREVTTSKADVTRDTFTIYISGIDTYGNISTVSRSDVNMLATINPKTHQVLLTSIPRDYYVQLHNTKGLKDKLTHAGIYGIDKSITTVEDLLNIDIDYYVRVNFTSLVKLVNAIGGVDIYSDTTFYGFESGVLIKKGMNHMNGEKALTFARERHAYASGDIHRNQNQQAVIKAIADKMLSSTTLLTKYSSILDSLSGSFETNFSSDNISKLVKGQLRSNAGWDIKTFNLTGTGSTQVTYSGGSMALSVLIPDQKSVNDAKTQIKSLYN